MTRITNTKLYRKYEQVDGKLIPRAKPIENPRLKTTLDCEGIPFTVYVSAGQFINRKKMCKRLLKQQRDEKVNNK